MLELRARRGLFMFKPGEEAGQGSVDSQRRMRLPVILSFMIKNWAVGGIYTLCTQICIIFMSGAAKTSFFKSFQHN